LPITGRTIPVIADDYVDPEFGSGCVKITPAHDFNDYAVGQRHNLSLLNIFTIDANLNENTPKAYQGKDRYEARKQIVADLEAQDLMEKIEPHKLMVPRGDRSHAVVEPYLTDQWYVKIQPLADPAIKAVEDGAIKFVPDNWSKTYFEWMRNIEDWCISRQLWWGHRIPAWYDEAGNIYVGQDEADVRQKHKLSDDIKLSQDEDVLDTWFSSALWPFSTLGWPKETQELKKFYPTSVLVTGFDIIFFWVARMIMMGIKFTGDVPFKEVFIHGLIRDSEGQKMSKSKGNILDPLDIIDGIDLESLIKKRTSDVIQPHLVERIEKLTRKNFPEGIPAYGTDALRFTLSTFASTGHDIALDPGRIGGSRNFCNKLWNATRYVLMNIDNQRIKTNADDIELGLAERWINTRLVKAIDQVTEGVKTYRFDLAAKALYEFTWDEYCDWYLELSKVTLTDEATSIEKKRGTLYTLVNNLEVLLRLMHPFMPFITEELWQKVAPIIGKEGNTIMLQPYPSTNEIVVEPATVAEIDWIKKFILGVRRIRAERDIAPNKVLPVKIQGGTEQENHWLQANTHYITAIAKTDSIVKIDTTPDDAVIALAGNMTLMVPLADIIDPQAELEKLEKELNKLNNTMTSLQKKLENQDFVDRAPEAVVQKEKERLEETQDAMNKLNEQYERTKTIIKQGA